MKFRLKNDSELGKSPIFDNFEWKSLTRYQKILWICSFGFRILSNFAWKLVKFHICHHANVHCGENGREFTFSCCKLAKGDTFRNCHLKTTQGKTLNAKENVTRVDFETNNVLKGIEARYFKRIGLSKSLKQE